MAVSLIHHRRPSSDCLHQVQAPLRGLRVPRRNGRVQLMTGPHPAKSSWRQASRRRCGRNERRPHPEGGKPGAGSQRKVSRRFESVCDPTSGQPERRCWRLQTLVWGGGYGMGISRSLLRDPSQFYEDEALGWSGGFVIRRRRFESFRPVKFPCTSCKVRCSSLRYSTRPTPGDKGLRMTPAKP